MTPLHVNPLPSLHRAAAFGAHVQVTVIALLTQVRGLQSVNCWQNSSAFTLVSSFAPGSLKAAPCAPFTTLSNGEMIHSEAPEIRAIRRTRRLSQPAEIGEALGDIVDRVFETCEDLIC